MNDLVMEKAATTLVAHLIYQVNGALPNTISLQDRLITDLAMDSVELIHFLMRLEEIGVVIAESELSSNLTVGDIVKRVQKVA